MSELLADRERLAAASELAEWARADAAPSDAEVEALRRLLAANDEVLAALDADERARVEEAVSTVRRARASLETTFPIQFRGLARQPRPELFPTIARQASYG